MTAIETEARIHRATELLLAARQDRRPLDGLPEDGRPRTIEEAWEIQDRVVEALGGRGGWKVGAATGDSEPGVAPLPAAGMTGSPARVAASGFNFVGIEAEIAFRFARDLPRREAPWTVAEVLAAVESVHPAIEIVDSRLAGWRTRTALEQAADLGNHGAFVLGPASPARADIDQRAVVARVSVDRKLRVEKTGGNTAVDVQRLLVWLANHCARRGTPIHAGDVVTSGSCTGLEIVGAPCSVTAELAGLGKVSVVVEA